MKHFIICSYILINNVYAYGDLRKLLPPDFCETFCRAMSLVDLGDLSEYVLMCQDFKDKDLYGADFTFTNLICSDFAGANLVKADFSGANVLGVNFLNANLKHAYALLPHNLPFAKLNIKIKKHERIINGVTKYFFANEDKDNGANFYVKENTGEPFAFYFLSSDLSQGHQQKLHVLKLK